MKLVSMKRADKPETVSPDDYSWGLRIHLDEGQLAALGITELPAVNMVMDVHARTVVVRTATENDGQGTERNLCLQITDLGLQKSDQRSVADRLYGATPVPEGG